MPKNLSAEHQYRISYKSITSSYRNEIDGQHLTYMRSFYAPFETNVKYIRTRN